MSAPRSNSPLRPDAPEYEPSSRAPPHPRQRAPPHPRQRAPPRRVPSPHLNPNAPSFVPDAPRDRVRRHALLPPGSWSRSSELLASRFQLLQDQQFMQFQDQQFMMFMNNNVRHFRQFEDREFEDRELIQELDQQFLLFHQFQAQQYSQLQTHIQTQVHRRSSICPNCNTDHYTNRLMNGRCLCNSCGLEFP